MPTFDVSMLADLALAGSVDVQAADRDEAVRAAMAMHRQGLVRWTAGGQSVGPYTGAVHRSWAVPSGTGGYTVSMQAVTSISGVEQVSAADAPAAVLEAESAHSRSMVEWSYRGVGVDYGGRIKRIWPETVDDPVVVEPDVPTSTEAAAIPDAIDASSGALTLTASVSSGRGAPDGDVTFYLNGVPLGTASVDGSGFATLTYVDGWPGTADVTVIAEYLGSGSFLSSSGSSSVRFNGPAGLYATIVNDSYAASDSEPTVQSGTTVEFNELSVSATDMVATRVTTDSSVVLSDAVTVDESLTVPSVSISDSPAATDSVTIRSYGTFSSATAITGPATGNRGDAATFTATVSSATSGFTPEGSVQFYEDAVPSGAPQVLDAFGQASLTTTPAAGTSTISATYTPSDGAHLTSGGSAQYTAYNLTALSVVLVGSPVQYGAVQTLRATVTSAWGTPAASSVDFYVGGAYQGTATSDGFGVAEIVLDPLSRNVGTYSVSSEYQATGLWTASSGSGTMQLSQASVAADAQTGSPDPSDYGQPWTLGSGFTSSTGAPITGTYRVFRDAAFHSDHALSGHVSGAQDSVAVGAIEDAAIGSRSWTSQFLGGTNFAASAASAAYVREQTRQDSYAGGPSSSPQTGSVGNKVPRLGNQTFSAAVTYERGQVESGSVAIVALSATMTEYALGSIPFTADNGDGTASFAGTLYVGALEGAGQYTLLARFNGSARTYAFAQVGTGNASTEGSSSPWWVV